MNPAYTQDEVIANFQAVMAGTDFSLQLRQLGIGAMQITRRKNMTLEFKGVFIGLWRLALARSFPDDGEEIFGNYLALCLKDAKKSGTTQQLVERARQYADMLLHLGDTDFSEASRHLASFLPLSDAARKKVTLKLALDLRRMYNFIFQRMI
jgi:hypothetical protein